ncbi:MAG: hypothetical protein K0Q83_3512, partial [Deltaproteobacteria bacterium]|nr:hypothetical protein [Deltaproteobacteria bacterium]
LGTGFDLRVFDWAKNKIREGTESAGRDAKEVAIVAAGMLCVCDDGKEARRIVRNRIANRAHHNFRFTLETVPAEELNGVQKFMAGFDVMKPMEDRVDPDLVNDYLVRRFSIAGTPGECIACRTSKNKCAFRALKVQQFNSSTVQGQTDKFKFNRRRKRRRDAIHQLVRSDVELLNR